MEYLTLLEDVASPYLSVKILLAATASLVFVWYIRHRAWTSRLQGSKLPPGPKGWPLLGNFFDITNVEHSTLR